MILKKSFFLASLTSLALQAQINTPESALKLDRLVVTATQTAIDVSQAPAAVSVVTRSDIELRGGVRLIENLKNLPGVFIRDSSLPSAWTGQVLIRGVAGYNRNAVLIDGQSLNNSFSSGANWSVVDPESVERVEVVRGPFSSLYGGSAMGGVVNIITRQPTQRSAQIKVGYGTDNLKSGYISYADRPSERFGFRLEAGAKSSDSYVQDWIVKTPGTGTGGAGSGFIPTKTSQNADAYIVGDKGASPWEQKNFAGSLMFKPSTQGTLTMSLRYHDHDVGFSHADSYVTASGTDIRSGNVAVNGTQRVTLSASDFTNGGTGEDSWRASAIYEHQFLNGARLKVDGYHTTSGYWYVTPTSGVATETGGLGKFVDIPSSRSALNAQTNIQLGSRQHLVAGVAYLRDELNKVESVVSDWRDRDSAQVGADTYRSDGYAETFALYLQDEITVSDQLTLYLGARYDHWFTWGTVEQFTAPAFRTDYARRDTGSLSPKLSAVFKATSSTTLRASIGSAFRAPTLSDMYSTWIATSGAVTYASADLKPETLRSAEVGIEQMLSARAKFSATVFQNELADMITSRSVANPTNPAINDSVRINIGKARSRGFEAGVEAELGEWHGTKFNAFANYTYTDTEVLENAAAPTSVGKRLTLIPEHMYSVGLDVRGARFFGHVSGRYVGKLYGNSANLDQLSDVYGSYDPNFVVDARVGWRATKSLTLTLSVFNALDESYFQSSVAPGRRFFGEVSYRF